MKFLKYLAIATIFLIPMSFQTAHAQVRVGVGIGVGVPYAPYAPYEYGPPACAYGYYGYAPYACAPYGYYGPNYFVDGVFIGVGPWFRGGYGYRGYGGRGFYGGVGYRGGYGIRGPVGGFRGGDRKERRRGGRGDAVAGACCRGERGES